MYNIPVSIQKVFNGSAQIEIAKDSPINGYNLKKGQTYSISLVNLKKVSMELWLKLMN